MSLKILLADDSMTAQNMGKKILSDAGYEVVAVSNGAAAMKKINAGQFDLLLLDVFMPGYTGPEVCAKARELKNYAKIPILFIVGKMEMGAFKVEDATKLKADGAIIKPFEASDLVTTVQKITAAAAPSKPSVPPEAEKTARITPITEDTDQSFAQWSATAAEHKEEGQETATPAVAASEMSAEAGAAAAFDEVAAAPAFDVSAGQATSFDLGSTPSYEATAGESTAADLGLGGAAAMEAPAIPLEPAAAPATPEPTAHFELETTPEPVHIGPVEPAPGIEFTSAAPVHVQVETAPELEVESGGPTHVAPDPNFMSDRSQMVTEFATKFTPTAGEEVSVGVVGEEVPAPAEATVEIPAPAASAEETAKLTPWVMEAPPVFSQSPGKIVSFAPAAELAEFLATPVEPTAPTAEAVPASMAQELEEAIITASAPEEPAPAVELPPPPPATLEASLEQSLQPMAAAAPVEEAQAEPMPAESEPKKPAGDLEFAQALEAAIAHAPEAAPEPHHAQAAAAPLAQAAAAAAGPAADTSAGIPELAGVDPQIIHRAVERVLANAKQDIIAEVLKELKK